MFFEKEDVMRFLKIFLAVAVLGFFMTAGAAEKKIRLSGSLQSGSVKRVTVSQMLQGLHFVEQEVYNPYEKRVKQYGGVMLDAFVKKYAKEDVKELHLRAIDNYEVVIPKKLWKTKRILLATDVNGKRSTLKSKGPLQIVFLDFSIEKKEFQSTIPLWIWMVTKIEFR